jgi:Kef-type K+ transport system membrane component KefB
MTTFIQLAIILAIILFFAKAGGALSVRIGQPSVFGELIVGIILGPSVINLFQLPFITSPEVAIVVKEMGEIGVLLLMFLAGLELHLEELSQNKGASAYGGVLGVITPIILGFIVGEFFGLDRSHSLFLGLTLGATSVSISAQTLMELKVLRSRVGLGLLGAAVFDDMLVILFLSIFMGLHTGGNLVSILLVILKMAAFLGGSVLLGLKGIPWISRRVNRLPISQGPLTIAIVIMLIYGIGAELVGGMAAITGAFIAGLMFSRTKEKSEIDRGLRAISYSFFVPIFFIGIGLSVNIRDLDVNAFWLMLMISVAGVIGKVVGSGLGAKLGKFSWLESLQLGIGMISRGEVGLIVASVGLQANLLSKDLFSSIVGMVIITTLITPPLLRASFGKPKQDKVIPTPN